MRVAANGRPRHPNAAAALGARRSGAEASAVIACGSGTRAGGTFGVWITCLCIVLRGSGELLV